MCVWWCVSAKMTESIPFPSNDFRYVSIHCLVVSSVYDAISYIIAIIMDVITLLKLHTYSYGVLVTWLEAVWTAFLNCSFSKKFSLTWTPEKQLINVYYIRVNVCVCLCTCVCFCTYVCLCMYLCLCMFCETMCMFMYYTHPSMQFFIPRNSLIPHILHVHNSFRSYIRVTLHIK